ncbi:YciI family protein [Actinoplanes xinjiangensis]|uniref:YciI family protein n=1 Tax=Actinoplanes xinjiangensis TaxID=512350 RepID=UPI00344526BA
MRYALMTHHFEPAEGELSDETLAAGRQAFDVYAKALHQAGVLLSADILCQTGSTTTVSRRDGTPRVQDGPFAETKEALAGVFLIDVPDLDAAIGWADKCPVVEWGSVEIRPVATSFLDGAWTH